jgi:hypothetical protein
MRSISAASIKSIASASLAFADAFAASACLLRVSVATGFASDLRAGGTSARFIEARGFAASSGAAPVAAGASAGEGALIDSGEASIVGAGALGLTFGALGATFLTGKPSIFTVMAPGPKNTQKCGN